DVWLCSAADSLIGRGPTSGGGVGPTILRGCKWAIAPSTTWRPIGRPPPSHAVRWRVSRIMAFQVLSSGSAHHASSPSRTMRGTVARVTRPQSAGAGIGSTHTSRRRSNPRAWAEYRAASRALVNVHAGVGRHRFTLLVPAVRTGQRGRQD